jgi:hypothetical protein
MLGTVKVKCSEVKRSCRFPYIKISFELHFTRMYCGDSVAQATTRQHMHYHTTDLKYETVMARTIHRVNAVASAAIGLGIAVRARGLATRRIGQDPPRSGWRMQDEITAAMDGPMDCAHLMSSEAFGEPD